MKPSTFIWRKAAAGASVLLGGGALVTAQGTLTSNSFTPGGTSTCSSGLATPTAQNGTYTDANGAAWAIECGQDSTGYVYTTGGTNGEGIYACFNGCDNRPSCVGFTFVGSATGEIDASSSST